MCNQLLQLIYFKPSFITRNFHFHSHFSQFWRSIIRPTYNRIQHLFELHFDSTRMILSQIESRVLNHELTSIRNSLEQATLFFRILTKHRSLIINNYFYDWFQVKSRSSKDPLYLQQLLNIAQQSLSQFERRRVLNTLFLSGFPFPLQRCSFDLCQKALTK